MNDDMPLNLILVSFRHQSYGNFMSIRVERVLKYMFWQKKER